MNKVKPANKECQTVTITLDENDLVLLGRAIGAAKAYAIFKSDNEKIAALDRLSERIISSAR